MTEEWRDDDKAKKLMRKTKAELIEHILKTECAIRKYSDVENIKQAEHEETLELKDKYIECLQKKITNLTEESKKKETTLANIKQQTHNLERKIYKVKNQKKELEQQNKHLSEQLISAYRASVDDKYSYQHEVKKVIDEFKDYMTEMNSEISKLTMENERLKVYEEDFKKIKEFNILKGKLLKFVPRGRKETEYERIVYFLLDEENNSILREIFGVNENFFNVYEELRLDRNARAHRLS